MVQVNKQKKAITEGKDLVVNEEVLWYAKAYQNHVDSFKNSLIFEGLYGKPKVSELGKEVYYDAYMDNLALFVGDYEKEGIELLAKSVGKEVKELSDDDLDLLLMTLLTWEIPERGLTELIESYNERVKGTVLTVMTLEELEQYLNYEVGLLMKDIKTHKGLKL